MSQVYSPSAFSAGTYSKPKLFRHRLVGDLARMHVEAAQQVDVLGQRTLGALVGEFQDERQRRVVEREG